MNLVTVVEGVVGKSFRGNEMLELFLFDLRYFVSFRDRSQHLLQE